MAELPPAGEEPEQKDEKKELEERAAELAARVDQLPGSAPEGMDYEQAVAHFGRDRKGLAEYLALTPTSLVGSYFHRVEEGEIVWAGIVVAELAQGSGPPVYLLEVAQGMSEDQRAPVQVPATAEQLETFRFFNTREKAQDAYIEHVVSEEVS
jgi:hypothetical protein